MSHGASFVYDDALGVPSEIGAIVGIPRFGALLHDRRRLRDHAESAATSAGFGDRAFLADRDDRVALAQAIADAPAGARYVWVSADVVGQSPEILARFLEKMAYAEQDVVAQPPGAPPPALILGFPVGFIGAAESKLALIANPRGVPFLALRGRRGGSALAAAAVNALFIAENHL